MLQHTSQQSHPIQQCTIGGQQFELCVDYLRRNTHAGITIKKPDMKLRIFADAYHAIHKDGKGHGRWHHSNSWLIAYSGKELLIKNGY